MTRLFGTTIFLSALLLFSVQPMVAKMVLPRFGGTPAVWNTCMVVYQALLLAGYAYSHFSCKWLGVRRQLLLHLCVLVVPLTVLPIAFSSSFVAPASSNPTGWLLLQLLAAVGLPFFAVSTTSPLIQSWLHRSRLRNAEDPYYLYAVGNAGSLLALLSYPLLVEPFLPLAQQSVVWSALYVLLVLLITACGVSVWRSSGRGSQLVEPIASDTADVDPISGWQRVRWMILALVPSSLMIGVTTHITTDIASVPLLWVLPLAIYLLSFVLTFSRKPPIPHRWMIRSFHFVILPLAFMVFAKLFQKEWLAILVHLGCFFVVAMVCHGELARSRPNARDLTEFYLWVSFGGVLGGCINAIAAPLLFNSVAEYPLMLVAACLLAPSLRSGEDDPRIVLGDLGWPCVVGVIAVLLAWVMSTVQLKKELEVAIQIGAPAAICLLFRSRPIRFAMGFVVILLASAHYEHQRRGVELYAVRGFFGVNRVTLDQTKQYHRLINGRTFHGVQQFYPEPSSEPLSYYHRSGPLGDVFASLSSGQSESEIAVVGLGIGAAASYIEPGQKMTFFEIDPDVRDIALNESLFTHLKDCSGQYEIVMGDARIQLEQWADRSFDILVIDAFSSDSIPAHLISVEAIELYLDKLTEDGVLVIHISNKFLRLEPLIGTLAEHVGMVGISRRDTKYDDPIRIGGKSSSHYVALARSESDLGALQGRPEWKPLKGDSSIRLWTDDYSNLLSLFVW